MDGLFVGSDVLLEIYRFALQLLAYIMGSAVLITFVGGLLCMTQVFRDREAEPELLRVQGAAAAGQAGAYSGQEPHRRLYLVRTQH